jgi:hypothetical protein
MSVFCLSMGCGVWLVFQHGLWCLVIVSAWAVVVGYCFSMSCCVWLVFQHGLWGLVIVSAWVVVSSYCCISMSNGVLLLFQHRL